MSDNEIIITTYIFPPEIHPSGVMNKELAGELVRKGYKVKVLTCFPSYPYGRIYPGWGNKLILCVTEDDIEIIRTRHFISPSAKIIIRSLMTLSQGFCYLAALKHVKRPIIIISDGPPIIGALVSFLFAKIKRARLVTIVHDFTVDVLAQSLKGRKSLINFGRFLETWSYRLSDRVIVPSEGFRRTLIRDKGLSPEKVVIVPVWLDGREIVPMERDNPWRRALGIGPEKFVVLYAGTIGLVSGAEVVVGAAKQLQSHDDILLLLVGEGRLKDRVEELARKAGLKNLRFLPFQPRERLSALQAAADVSLVTLAPGRGRTSVPSKVLGYMAAARPVIASVDAGCDTAELISNAGCGLVTPPGDAGSLARAVLHLYKHPELRRQMGRRGHKYFDQNLERRRVLARYVAILEKTAANSQPDCQVPKQAAGALE
jgi:colanic acid biosynthesis glycosyl transferase WcaI